MDLSINLFHKTLKNPLIAASGCFGFGREASAYSSLSDWGAICSKGLTRFPRMGNASPRVCETASGMLNSVGLQNPGIEAFIRDDLDFMLNAGSELIVNVAGNSADDYVHLCSLLQDPRIFAIELNLSCPNVKSGCMAIGSNPEEISKVVAAVRQISRIPLIAKLTPNVTDITDCARAAEAAGADAVSLVNTFLAMAVDLKSKRPVLRNNTGGLSGPAIKPIALRMTADVYRAVKIPVLAMGGISTGRDVLEFILAGATAVQLGMVNFYRPLAAREVAEECCQEGEKLSIPSLYSWRGSLEYWEN